MRRVLCARRRRRSGISTRSCLQTFDLLAKHPGLLPASAFALNLYTLDTRQLVPNTPKHVNFFCECAQTPPAGAARY